MQHVVEMSISAEEDSACFFSEEDFREFSVLSSVQEYFSRESLRSGHCVNSWSVEPEQNIGAAPSAHQFALESDVHGLSDVQNTSLQRNSSKLKRHSCARMGSDKLQVRASADTPYDLDTVLSQTESDTSWYSSDHRNKTGVKRVSSEREEESDFFAKLQRFKAS